MPYNEFNRRTPKRERQRTRVVKRAAGQRARQEQAAVRTRAERTLGPGAGRQTYVRRTSLADGKAPDVAPQTRRKTRQRVERQRQRRAEVRARRLLRGSIAPDLSGYNIVKETARQARGGSYAAQHGHREPSVQSLGPLALQPLIEPVRFANSKSGPLTKALLDAAQYVREGVTKNYESDRGRPDLVGFPGATVEGPKGPPNHAVAKFAGNLAADPIDLAAQAVPSTAITFEAINAAVGGDTSQAKELWREYKKTGLLPALVTLNLKEAGRRAYDHPVAGALELSGLKAGVGRSIGTAARTVDRFAGVPKGKAGGLLGATERPDLSLLPSQFGHDHPLRLKRDYSRDAITKLVQVGLERRAARGKRGSSALLGVERGHPNVAAPGRAAHHRRRILDDLQFMGEGLKKDARSRAGRVVKENVAGQYLEETAHHLGELDARKGHPHAFAARLLIEGIVRPKHFKADLEKFRDVIHETSNPRKSQTINAQNLREGDVIDATGPNPITDVKRVSGGDVAVRTATTKGWVVLEGHQPVKVSRAEERKLTHGQKASQDAVLEQLGKLLTDKELLRDPQAALGKSEAVANYMNELDRKQRELGLLTEGEESAKFIPAAIAHLGAERVTRQPTPALHRYNILKKRAKGAASEARNAARDYETGRRRTARARGRASVTPARGPRTEEVNVAERVARQARTELNRLNNRRVGEARAEGEARVTAKQAAAAADRRLLEQSDEYRKARAARDEAAKEVAELAKHLRNVQNNPHLYTHGEASEAIRLHHVAQGIHKDAKTALRGVLRDIEARAERAAREGARRDNTYRGNGRHSEGGGAELNFDDVFPRILRANGKVHQHKGFKLRPELESSNMVRFVKKLTGAKTPEEIYEANVRRVQRRTKARGYRKRELSREEAEVIVSRWKKKGSKYQQVEDEFFDALHGGRDNPDLAGYQDDASVRAFGYTVAYDAVRGHEGLTGLYKRLQDGDTSGEVVDFAQELARALTEGRYAEHAPSAGADSLAAAVGEARDWRVFGGPDTAGGWRPGRTGRVIVTKRGDVHLFPDYDEGPGLRSHSDYMKQKGIKQGQVVGTAQIDPTGRLHGFSFFGEHNGWPHDRIIERIVRSNDDLHIDVSKKPFGSGDEVAHKAVRQGRAPDRAASLRPAVASEERSGTPPAPAPDAGRKGALPDIPAAAEAPTPAVDEAIAKLGRQPAATLATLERARGSEVLTGAEITRARAAVREADKAVEAARNDARNQAKQDRAREAELSRETELALLERKLAAKENANAARKAANEAKPAKGDRYHTGFVVNGRQVSNKVLGDLLRDVGINPDQIAFVSEKPFSRGAVNYHVGNDQRPEVRGKHRSGEAVRIGAIDTSKDALRESLSRAAVRVTQAENFDRTFELTAVRAPVLDEHGNRIGARWLDDGALAKDVAAEVSKVTGLEMVPVNLASFALSAEKRGIVADRLAATGDLDPEVLNGLSDALLEAFTKPEGPGRWALAPKEMVTRLRQHNHGSGAGARASQAIGSQWVRNVLSFSPKWLPGNIIDLTGRSILAGVTPLDVYRGTRLMRDLRAIDPAAARELRELAVGGNLYTTTLEGQRVRTADQFIGTGLEQVALGMAYLVRSRPGRAFRALYNGWVKAVFGINRAAEIGYNLGALGKHTRREVGRTMEGVEGFMVWGGKGYKDFLNGLENTVAQRHAARTVEDIFGRWGKMGPAGRDYLIHYAPFLQWARVATKYVFYTLPAQHPIKTGILAAMYEMTEHEREALGMTLFPDADATYRGPSGERDLPDFMQGSVPLPDGSRIRFQGFTSFGVSAGFPGSLTDFVLPQFSTTLDNWRGLAWNGNKLRHGDGTDVSRGDRVLIGIDSLLSGVVPLWSHAHRFMTSGNPAVDSTLFHPKTKKGAKHGVGHWANRTFNPLRPIAPQERSGGAGNVQSGAGDFDLDSIQINGLEDLDFDPNSIQVNP